jgi:hypothetical protein
MHPNLAVDLLGEMIQAAKEVGVDTPIYISAGLDEKAAREHPEWLIRNRDESTRWTKDFTSPGFHELCFNTPYLDELLEQIKEVLVMHQPSGLWLDIVGVRPCYCRSCVKKAKGMELDINNPNEMVRLWEDTFKSYQKKVAELVKVVSPNTEIFHNSGHFARGREDLWGSNTHYELESLPTGGWSYDHFPISARYIQGFGKEFLGMTGKFHTSWGEFGGFKHPNALRYETSLALMNGAKCCIGDQLHPNGEMDMATYELIGTAYKEVEEKEPWCDSVESIADIGLFSAEVIEGTKMMSEFNNLSDSGAARMLFEGHYLFDVIDQSTDFNKYKLIILPDKIRLQSELEDKLNAYLSKGGKILASGEAGLLAKEDIFGIDLGVKYVEKNVFQPTYFKPGFELKSVKNSSFIMYEQSHVVESRKGEVLGSLENPEYNSCTESFCSHKHFPTSNKKAGDGMIMSKHGCYIAWDVFKDYATVGSLVYKEMVHYALERLIGNSKTIETSMPVQGIVSLMVQKDKKRYINHHLYAIPVMRGKNINIIEDIQPIYGVKVELKTDQLISRVYLAPQMEELSYKKRKDGISYIIPKIECHEMVVIDYE